MDIAGTDVALELGLPELLHDLLAREDLAGILRQEAEDLELRPRQVDRLAADADQVPGDRSTPAPPRSRSSAPLERSSSRRRSAHLAEQLSDRERLGDVVVGTTSSPTTLSTSASLAVSRMIGTGLARTSRQMSRPLFPGIRMSRIRRSKLSSEIRPSASSPSAASHLEPLLLQRVADRFADGEFVVHNQDLVGSRRIRAHATGVGVGLAARSRTQKVLPEPGSERSPISPPMTSTIRFAIDRPSPKPSPSRVAEPR